MKKKIIASALAATALSVCMLISGCGTKPVGIASIEKTATDGLVDTYTITYTDGSTYNYTVTNGLDSGVSVRSIEKSESVGIKDYYTVTFTDGRTTSFCVTNGKDAEKLTAADVYEEYKKQCGEELTFAQFCERFLVISKSPSSVAASCLLSSGKVYTAFTIEEKINSYVPHLGYVSNTVTRKSLSSGASVIYRMEEQYTYVLTNYHVVYSSEAKSAISDEITMYMYGSESSPEPVKDGDGNVQSFNYDSYALSCEYVGGAVEYDLAVLRLKTEDLVKVSPQAAAVKVADGYSVGEECFAVGNTNDDGITVTRGIVSVDREPITLNIDGISRVYRSLRTDAMIYEGNSGGGLFNAEGELIGVCHAGDSDIGFMNYAIPTTVVTGIADGIIHYALTANAKATKKLLLGVTVVSENSRYVYDAVNGEGHIEEDVTVDEVVEGSIAQQLGLAKGDVINSIEINGVSYAVKRHFGLGDLLITVRAGDSVKLGYTRGGSGAYTEVLNITEAKLTDVK